MKITLQELEVLQSINNSYKLNNNNFAKYAEVHENCSFTSKEVFNVTLDKLINKKIVVSNKAYTKLYFCKVAANYIMVNDNATFFKPVN